MPHARPNAPSADGPAASRAVDRAAAGGIEVSIIVVSYNTRALTLRCLDTVVAETRIPHEIIVLDNDSTDGSAEAIAAHPANVRLIASRENHGFARGNNVAATHARGRYLLLLNPDTEVTAAAIDRLVAFADTQPDARIWGGRTLFPDGRLNPASCWSRMTPWNQFCRATGLAAIFKRCELFNGEAFGGWDRSTERQVDIVSGCFFLIRREDWQRLGGFDASYFMYGEEADLCLRATSNLGARPRVTPEATIIHIGGASERARAGKMIRLLAAKATLIRRHWSPSTIPLGLALLAAWPLSRLVATTLTRRAAASEWREIWRARSQWLAGYPRETTTPTELPMSPVAA